MKPRMMRRSMEGAIISNESKRICWNIPIIPNFQSGFFFTTVEISGFELPYSAHLQVGPAKILWDGGDVGRPCWRWLVDDDQKAIGEPRFITFGGQL